VRRHAHTPLLTVLVLTAFTALMRTVVTALALTVVALTVPQGESLNGFGKAGLATHASPPEVTPLPPSSPVPSADPLRIGSNGEQALDQRPKPRAPSEHLVQTYISRITTLAGGALPDFQRSDAQV
jgi:hypothetical protein